MKKGISIPITTLVILAIAIVVMLAIIAWFMGAFTPSGRALSAQQKFNMACRIWTTSNCANTGDADNVPNNVCDAYMNMTSASTCDHDTVARACGCTPPFGTGETTTAGGPTTVAGGSTTTIQEV